MAKVTIERTGDADGYERVGLTVKVDGVTVGDGSIGGEPEDNSEARDYRWIRPMIRNLATTLGAEVETVQVVDPDDEGEEPPMTLGEFVMFGDRPAVPRG